MSFSPGFISWRDLPLFVRSARTDATLRRRMEAGPARAAFEAAYEEADDPWASADPRYRYQSRKYEGMLACLPAGRRFSRALDLGCGLGLLAARLAARADAVVGIDLAQSALDRAARRTRHLPQLTYRQADIAALPDDLDGRFDLVVVADTLYYLARPIADATLLKMTARLSRLLAPGGLLLLANHWFFGLDAESKLTSRIHAAFRTCPSLTPRLSARRFFYRVDVLAGV